MADRARGRRRRKGGVAPRRRADRRRRRAPRSPSGGSFTLAMSGGRTPWAMLAILGELEEMPWEKTELFQVDERVASPGRRGRATSPTWCSGSRWITRRRCGRCRSPSANSNDAAREYEDTLPERSTASTSASAPTATPPRWSRRPGARGQRPPRRDDRERLPGPPPHDPHLPGAERRPPDRLAGHRPRQGASRWPSCSPATPRSPPGGSRTRT